MLMLEEALWVGSARAESLNFWNEHGWHLAAVKAYSFWERPKGGGEPEEQKVPIGHVLLGMVKKHERWGNIFRLLTRPAEKGESQVHGRWVVIVEE